MYRTSDVVNVLPAGGYGGYGNGFGGGDGWLGLAALALLGGNGLWGGRGGYNDGCCGGGLANELATDTSAIQNRIGEEAIEEKVCRVEMAIGEAKYATALGQKDLTAEIAESKYDLGSKIDACCCNTQRSIDRAEANILLSNERQTCHFDQQFCNTNQLIKDGFNKLEMDALKERIRVQDALLFQASQENQTRRIEAFITANTPTATA